MMHACIHEQRTSTRLLDVHTCMTHMKTTTMNVKKRTAAPTYISVMSSVHESLSMALSFHILTIKKLTPTQLTDGKKRKRQLAYLTYPCMSSLCIFARAFSRGKIQYVPIHTNTHTHTKKNTHWSCCAYTHIMRTMQLAHTLAEFFVYKYSLRTLFHIQNTQFTHSKITRKQTEWKSPSLGAVYTVVPSTHLYYDNGAAFSSPFTVTVTP